MNKKLNKNNSVKIVLLLLIFTLNLFTLVSCKKEKTEENIVPSSIITSVNEVTLEVGESTKVDVSFEPSNTNFEVIWVSNNNTIASVSSGTITGVEEGVTTVSVICSKYTNIKKDITVNVVPKTYAINYNLDGGVISDTYPTRFDPEIGVELLPIPTKADHKFEGWYIGDDLVDGISAGINDDVTVTAKWNKYPTTMLIEPINEDLYTGKTYQLVVSSDKENESYSFESSDDSVLTISSEGLINCVGKGNVTIKVQSLTNPNTKALLTVKVLGIPTSFRTANSTKEIFIGSKTTFKLTASPSGSYNKVIWSSSDESILTINENGVVEAISEGVATIKGVSVLDQNVYFEREITVKTPATSVEIFANKQEGYIGEYIQLIATVYPSSVSSDVLWSSSDESIADVNADGIVYIMNRGTVTITASSFITPSVKAKVTITCLHELLEEENSDVKYIICAPGTDASTQISINYHAKNTKTSIEYTTADDTSFENALSYKPNGVYFEELNEELDGPFEARNVFSAEIGNLTPNTKYIFRINCGDNTYSDIYHFTTASGNKDDFSFIWLTDNHYHYLQGEETTGPEVSEKVIEQAIKLRPDLAFVFDTGDMIDTGGNSNIWDLMFKKRHTLKLLPMVSTTGNHELYIANTGQWDNRFHAAYNALPKNGVEGKVGTSCYYYYNDTLLILIENMNSSSYNLQLEWMENLFKEARYEKKASTVIVGMHGPIQTETGADRDEKMMALFEKYSVDLVLTGHYHTDEVTRNYFRGTSSSNDLLGVNYMIGSSSGAKGVGSNDPLEFAKGYIVDVVGTKITVTRIDANGKVYSVREFESKKFEEVSEEAKNTSKETIMNSFNYTLNQNTNVATFTWTPLAYGNVDKITFEEINRNEVFEEVIIINQAFTDALIPSITNYYDSKIKISVYFNDGEVISKEITISRNTDYNLTINKINETSLVLKMNELSNVLSNIVKKFKIYVNGSLYKTLDFNGITNPVNNFEISDLTSLEGVEIKVIAVNNNDLVIFENIYK